MPWDVRNCQAELLAEQPRDGIAVPAQRGERARRSAELQGERVAPKCVECSELTCGGREPTRRLHPERDRHGLLQERSPSHEGTAMRLRQVRARPGRSTQLSREGV